MRYFKEVALIFAVVLNAHFAFGQHFNIPYPWEGFNAHLPPGNILSDQLEDERHVRLFSERLEKFKKMVGKLKSSGAVKPGYSDATVKGLFKSHKDLKGFKELLEQVTGNTKHFRNHIFLEINEELARLSDPPLPGENAELREARLRKSALKASEFNEKFNKKMAFVKEYDDAIDDLKKIMDADRLKAVFGKGFDLPPRMDLIRDVYDAKLLDDSQRRVLARKFPEEIGKHHDQVSLRNAKANWVDRARKGDGESLLRRGLRFF